MAFRESFSCTSKFTAQELNFFPNEFIFQTSTQPNITYRVPHITLNTFHFAISWLYCTEGFNLWNISTVLPVSCWKLSQILKIEQYLKWRKYTQNKNQQLHKEFKIQWLTFLHFCGLQYMLFIYFWHYFINSIFLNIYEVWGLRTPIFFWVPEGFDYHRPSKMGRGTDIFFGSVTFLAFLKVQVPAKSFLFMGDIKRRVYKGGIFSDHNNWLWIMFTNSGRR